MTDYPAEQLGLGLIGYDEAVRQAALHSSKSLRTRALNRIETIHDLLSQLPTSEDLTFNDSWALPDSACLMPDQRRTASSGSAKRAVYVDGQTGRLRNAMER